MLLGAVGLVLLIACATVPNLLLVRADRRSQEVALATALGATRGQIVSQHMLESLLLALAGGTSGTLVAIFGVRALVATVPASLASRYAAVGVDWSVLGFTFVVTALTGLVFGTLPALYSSAAQPIDALKQRSRSTTTGRRSNRLRSGLVSAEIALALVLLVGAALLLRSFANLTAESPGFDADSIVTAGVSLPETKYPEPDQRIAFFEALQHSLAGTPGVVAAAFSTPMLGGWQNGYSIEGQPDPANGQRPLADQLFVNPSYHTVMGIPLLRGRFLTDEDVGDAPPVALIDETLAERGWPGQDAVGKRVSLHGDWLEVVGVVGHVKSYGIDRDSGPQVYLPHAQYGISYTTLFIKTDGPVEGLAALIRDSVADLDPEQPVFEIAALEDHLAAPLTARRLTLTLVGLFAAISLTLAAVGISGLMAYVVNQRVHEFGVRLAIGATSSDLLRLIVASTTKLVLIGIGTGLFAILGLAPALGSLLFGVAPLDPLTLAGAALVLAGATFGAAVIPALRVLKIRTASVLLC